MRIIYNINRDLIGVITLLVIGLLFFYKIIFFGLLPVPSDSLVGLYHPWRDQFSVEYPRGVPFKNFLTTDPVRQQIPWRHTVVEEVKAGIKPLWSPYSFGGAPLSANIQSGAWSPFNFLFFIFDFSIAWTILIIIQPLLAMIFMYLFLRHFKNSRYSSLFGSIIWGFSGFSIAWLTWGTIGSVALWLPVLLLLTDLMLIEKMKQKQFLWVIIFVLVNFVQLSAGHAQTSLYVLGLTAVYGVWRVSNNFFKQKSIVFSISWILSFFVTFPVWKPMLDVINVSQRFSQSDWLKEGWFFPLQHVAQFVAPDFFGNPTTMNYWGVWNYGEMIGYIGVLGSILATGIFFVKKTRDELFWVYVLAVTCIFMTPNPIGEAIYRLQLPVFSSLQPTRLLIIVDFALSVLAANGFMKLEKGERKPVISGIFIIGFSLVLLWVTALYTKNQVSLRNLYVPSGLFLLFSFLGVACVRFRKNKRAFSIFLILFLTLTGIDMFRFGWKFIPFSESRFFFPETESIKYLKRQNEPFRVLSVDDRLFAPNTLEYYGIESVSGYDPLFSKRYAIFIDSLQQKKVVFEVSDKREITPSTESNGVLSLLNIKYVVSLNQLTDSRLKLVFEEGQTKVYENSMFLPRVYFARDVLNVESDVRALSYIVQPTFLPDSHTVVLHGDIKKQSELLQGEKVEIAQYTFGNMILKTDTMQERFLVVLNPNYAGWKAYIDGNETGIFSTNYLFMGISVPKGQHEIRIEYR